MRRTSLPFLVEGLGVAVFCTREVAGLISDSNTLKCITQQFSLLLVTREESIFPVELHLTCSQHLGLFDLCSAQLHLGLPRSCLVGWRVSDTASLGLINGIRLALCCRLIYGGPILLRDFASPALIRV